MDLLKSRMLSLLYPSTQVHVLVVHFVHTNIIALAFSCDCAIKVTDLAKPKLIQSKRNAWATRQPTM